MLERLPFSESFLGRIAKNNRNNRRFLPIQPQTIVLMEMRQDSRRIHPHPPTPRRDRIAQVATGTIEVKTIPILFGHRVQLSIPLSVLLFLAQFLKLFVWHYWDHIEK
jgi:hypothetical protein